MNQMSKIAKKIVVFSTTKSDDTGVVHTQVDKDKSICGHLCPSLSADMDKK